LQDLHRSPSILPPDETNVDIPTFDHSNFQLPEPDLVATAHQTRADPTPKLAEESLFVPDVASEMGSEAEAEEPAQVDEALESEPSSQPNALPTVPSKAAPSARSKKLKMTRHGEMVPSLPSSLIKRIAIEAQEALGNRRPKFGKDHMKALEQATEWYFEQVGEDLAAFSDHARRRKRIDKSDALLLLRRQRLLQGEGELLEAAKELLPKDVVADMDLEDSSEA
jgi:histone H3/H4